MVEQPIRKRRKSKGNKRQAFEYLEKAYQGANPGSSLLRADLRMDTLRSDPWFQDLLRRMNFPQ